MSNSNPNDRLPSSHDQHLAGLDALSASTDPIESNGFVAGEDELSIVPDLIHGAPQPVQSAQPARPKADRRRGSSIESRRTAIPIFLVTGILFFALGLLWFATPEDSPFREPGVILPAALIPFGLTLVGLGLMNAVEVHRRMRER